MTRELFDDYIWTKENKTLTHTEHGIPGLGNFTHKNTSGSTPPSPLHYHTNILEIHCMVKGQRTSVIEKNGQFNTYTFAGNTAFLTFPFEIHGNGDQAQLPCEFYGFQIDLSEPGNLLGLNREYSSSLAKLLLNQKDRQLRLNASHLNYLRTSFNFISSFSLFHSYYTPVFSLAFYTACSIFSLRFRR